MGRSGYTCVRRVFCWLNVLLWLCGCGLLGAGLWLRFAYEGYTTLLPKHSTVSADSILISVGVITFVVAFFGCCGSWFQSRCLLITYFILVVVLFLGEFLIGALSFVYREEIGHSLKIELQHGIENHYNGTEIGEPGQPNLAEIWDRIQLQFHCCGVSTYEDWYDIASWPTERWVPQSCCRNITLAKSGFSEDISLCGHAHNPELWWSQGCIESIQMWLVQRLHIVGVVGLVVAFIQLFGLISSMLLFCTVRHKRSSHTYKSYSPHS